jgi:hypothetical protein
MAQHLYLTTNNKTIIYKNIIRKKTPFSPKQVGVGRKYTKERNENYDFTYKDDTKDLVLPYLCIHWSRKYESNKVSQNLCIHELRSNTITYD